MASTNYNSNTGNVTFYTYDPFEHKWLDVLVNGKIYETDCLSAESTAKIKKVVYLDNRTITLWSDGETVEAKCMENDVYNKEYGLIVCMLKKQFGSWSKVEEGWINPLIEGAKIIEP